MPRRRNSSCTISAMSRSSCGRICARGEKSVQRTPQLWKNSAYSQPVAPAPTTSRCSGNSCISSTCRVVMTRWWSTCAKGGSHGDAPVAISRWSYSSARTPSSVVTSSTPSCAIVPCPYTTSASETSRRWRIEPAWCAASQRAWAIVASRSTEGRPCSKRTPIRSAPSTVAITDAVCSSVFDGIASVSVQFPPRPRRSTTVTRAPSAAAVPAAAYPPGPPPRITKRMLGVYVVSGVARLRALRDAAARRAGAHGHRAAHRSERSARRRAQRTLPRRVLAGRSTARRRHRGGASAATAATAAVIGRPLVPAEMLPLVLLCAQDAVEEVADPEHGHFQPEHQEEEPDLTRHLVSVAPTGAESTDSERIRAVTRVECGPTWSRAPQPASGGRPRCRAARSGSSPRPGSPGGRRECPATRLRRARR